MCEQGQGRPAHLRVVVEERHGQPLSGPPAVEQAVALRSCGAAPSRRRRAARASQSGRAKMAGSIGQGRDHQAVPVGQHLVVAARRGSAARAPRAGWRRLRASIAAVACGGRPGSCSRLQDVAPLPVAAIGDAVGEAEGGCIVSQELVDLRRRPRRRTGPPRPRCRRRARRRRRPRPASHAAASRRSPPPWPRTVARPWRPTPRPAARAAARCRRASSRNAARANRRRRRSGRSRRPDDRRCRPGEMRASVCRTRWRKGGVTGAQGGVPDQAQHGRLGELRRSGKPAVHGVEAFGERACHPFGERRSRRCSRPRARQTAAAPGADGSAVAGDAVAAGPPELGHLLRTWTKPGRP